MATTLKLRRGTTAQHSSFTGAAGEVTVDTDKDTVVVHDGTTAGGFPLARDSAVLHTTGAESAAGLKTFGDGIATDTIAEETSAAGVTVDGVLLKDSQVTTDQINEKTSAAGVTVDGVLLKDNGASLGGNLTFTGSGNRITGDFTNATVANRVMFQSSTANGQTALSLLPNGTSTQSQVLAYSGTDPANSNIAQTLNNGTEVSFRSAAIGTGSYLPMTFYNGGSERMRIDTSGNVGIGTSSPSYPLQITRSGVSSYVANTDGAGTLLSGVNGSGLGVYGTFSNTAVAFFSNSTERMRIHAGGNATIGATTNPGPRLSVYAPANTGCLYLESDASNSVGGQIAMANTGRGAKYIRVDTDNELQVVNDAYTTILFRLTNAGAAFKADNTTTWSTVSDIRIKENIRPVTNALDKICALNPCYFEYKTRLGETATGFIAQEYEQVLPEHVFESLPGMEFSSIVPADEKIKGINPDLVPYLVKAIQEQQAIIESLKTRIETLEAQA
jgi:hypothetical protein